MKKFSALSLSRYLAELSSDKPVPGGGSVSAYAASLGMGLIEMVAGIGIRKAEGPAKIELQKTIKFLRKARKDTLQIVDLDPKIYQAVMDTYAKARSVTDPAKKEKMIDRALENSFRLQADLAMLVIMAKESIVPLDSIIKGSIKNDLRVSRALLTAAFEGAYATAEINVIYLKDPVRKKHAEQALEELKTRFHQS